MGLTIAVLLLSIHQRGAVEKHKSLSTVFHNRFCKVHCTPETGPAQLVIKKAPHCFVDISCGSLVLQLAPTKMSSKRFQPRSRSLHSAKAGNWESLSEYMYLSGHAHSSKSAESAAKEEETDPHKISKRMKQLGFGYNTAGYQRYLASVPK